MRTIYLDYNATTPIAPDVRQAMLPFLEEHYGNPSSLHSLGRAAHEAVELARAQVANLLGAHPDEIVFTSGGTESNNLAIQGAAFGRALDESAGAPGADRGHIVISAIEHPSVTSPARFLERLGFRLSVIGVDDRGQIDIDRLESALAQDTILISVMHANNETGVIQPLRRLSQLCRPRGILLHTDAAQSVGKVSVRVDDLGVDLLTIAGHKAYAPKGVGALYVRRGARLSPVTHGAGQEAGLRAGTENVPYIVGLGRTAALAATSLPQTGIRMGLLRDRLFDLLSAAIGPGLTINGAGAERLPNTLSVNFPHAVGHELLRRSPELCASTGSACHSGAAHPSPTLAAMGLASETARGAVRLSVGWTTEQDEIDRAASLLIAAWENSR